MVSYWQKYVHEVLVNRLGGLSLPRKSVVRLTDRPDMTLDVYCGRKTTIQQQQQYKRDLQSFFKTHPVAGLHKTESDILGNFGKRSSSSYTGRIARPVTVA